MTFPAPARTVVAARRLMCRIYHDRHCNLVHARTSTRKHVWGICEPRAVGAWYGRFSNRLTMPVLSRRRFLAASAASAASAGAPALGAQAGGEVDIAVIGAGAAGIAATRRIAGTRVRVALIEASARVGGRCITDTSTFDVPFDRGAHWIHMPDLNPVTPLAMKSGFDIYPAPPGQRVRIGRRNARESEMEDYLTATVRTNRAIAEAGRGGRSDVSCAQALPEGPWRLAADHRIRARPVRLRQGPHRRVRHGFCSFRRARYRHVLPAGVRRVDRQARGRPAGAIGEIRCRESSGAEAAASRSKPPRVASRRAPSS